LGVKDMDDVMRDLLTKDEKQDLLEMERKIAYGLSKKEFMKELSQLSVMLLSGREMKKHVHELDLLLEVAESCKVSKEIIYKIVSVEMIFEFYSIAHMMEKAMMSNIKSNVSFDKISLEDHKARSEYYATKAVSNYINDLDEEQVMELLNEDFAEKQFIKGMEVSVLSIIASKNWDSMILDKRLIL
jgi:hypothetical protein